MDSSPLPTRTRPGSLAPLTKNHSTTSKSNDLYSSRNPFSLSRSSSSIHSGTGAQKMTQQSRPKDVDDIEDSEEEEDDEEDDGDGEDELAGVGGFANSPYFTQPTQVVTQPTQILKKPITNPREAIAIPSSSPPRSVVEVPASSPFQSPKPPQTAPSSLARGRLGSLMAPAGTVFRSPMAAPKASPLSRGREQTRATNENRSKYEDDDLDDIIRIDDSSDDGDSRPARGDIRPSSFKRPAAQPPAVAAVPKPALVTVDSSSSSSNTKALNDRKVLHLVGKMQSQLRSKGYNGIGNDACRKALLERNYNVQEAVADLLDEHLSALSSPPAPRPQSRVPDMIRSFAYQANGNGGSRNTTTNNSGASSPATPSSQQSQKRRALSPSPKPKRRRLVQGRKYRTFSSSQPGTPAQETSRLVDLVKSGGSDDDEGEDDEGDSSPPIVISDDDAVDDDDVVEVDDDGDALEDDDAIFDVEKRVLEYFNTCTVDDLVAMLGPRARSKAETVLSHRPFRTRASVTRIRSNAAAGSRGKKATNIGEDIFDAVHDYVVALQAIDIVVAQCEQKGLHIRSTLHRWNVDFRGSSKAAAPLSAGTGVESGRGDGLLTPSSEVGGSGAADRKGYVPLPIPQEPAFMRGHCTMKGYQLYGLNWLWELYQRNFGCILADDMGLGKTCQVISFLSHLIESYNGSENDESRPWPNLVIVPPSTLANWKTEFKKFAPKVRVTTYSGSAEERDRIYFRIQEDRSRHHVVLTSYTQLSGKQDLDAMRKIAPNVAIFDEGHQLKNANTVRYKSLKRINANWRLILTGTPVQNNLMEMINLLNFIQPSLFERHLEKLGDLFSQRFTLQDVSNGALLFSDRVRRARSILEPFILQRRKEQVLSSMPNKTTRVVYCDLDDTQKPIYESYERQFREGKNKTAGAKPEQSSRRSTAITGLSNDQNNVWIQLRKSAIHGQLFRRYYDDKKVEKMAKILMAEVPQAELRQPDIKHLINELRDCSDFELHTWCRDYRCLAKFDIPDGSFLHSGKVRELLNLIEAFQKNGDRALVFTRFARVLNILREVLSYSGIEYVSLEGATRVEERQAIIDEFNDNPAIPVFLLTTGSGGTGINLTAANKVVIFDQSDNPQDDVQAENRAHRLGQTRDVEVVKLVTRGTIEELVYKACQTKLELAARVTASGVATDQAAAAAELLAMEDGDKVAKAVEEEVRRMLLAKSDGKDKNSSTTTPPKSDAGSSSDYNDGSDD